MLVYAFLALAKIRRKLAAARARARALAASAQRAVSDGIVCSVGIVAAAVATLIVLTCVTGCPAPAPPANGSISVAWTLESIGGGPITCEQVDARFAALRFRNRTSGAVTAVAFPCANSPGTASIPPGRYDVSFLLNGADGKLLGTAPDQIGIAVLSGQTTRLAPATFTFGVTPKTTLVLKLSTSAQTNCGTTSGGGAGITGNTIVLIRGDGGCAPAIFTRERRGEPRGTYQVNCSSPMIAPCIEKDETLTTTLLRDTYNIRVLGKVGVLECWTREDTLDIPVGGNVTRTLGLARTGNPGCVP